MSARQHRPLLSVLFAAALVGAALPADAQSLAVSAVVLSKSNCKFSAGAVPDVDFGLVNPSSSGTITSTVTKTFVCQGSAATASFAVGIDDGLNASGPGIRRIRHTTAPSNYMAYGLTVTPTTGTVAKGTPVTITLTGTLTPVEYANAPAGMYQDTVAITLNP